MSDKQQELDRRTIDCFLQLLGGNVLKLGTPAIASPTWIDRRFMQGLCRPRGQSTGPYVLHVVKFDLEL
jgi:hypothetical protein